jgi:hypothetical protein
VARPAPDYPDLSATVASAGESSASARTRHPLRIFAIAYLLVFAISAAWSLATPLYASPDEPVQVIKAVAVSHGQLVGKSAGPTISPHVVVSVPASFVSGLHVPTCFVGKLNVTPTCSPPLSQATQPLDVSIYIGRYPPLYYAFVGIPSWFSDSVGVAYAMRLLSAALCALFLALAITAVMCWSRLRIGILGVLLAATPQVLFLFGVTNASSLEIAAAICCWTTMLLLALGGDAPPPRGLVAIASVASITEVLSRALSPLWLLVAFVIASGIAGRRRLMLLARARNVQVGAGLVVVATVVAFTWTVHFHAIEVQTVQGAAAHAITGPYSRALLGRQDLYLQETIGRFGTLNVPPPGVTYAIWELASIAVVGLALCRARWRGRLWTVVIVAAAFVIPFAIILSQASSHHGLIWQGRDGAPLTLAIPIVAALVISGQRRWRRFDAVFGTLVAALLVVAQIGSFTGALNRYVVGFDQQFDFFEGALWQPPLGATTLLIVVSVALALGFGCLAVSFASDSAVVTAPAGALRAD